MSNVIIGPNNAIPRAILLFTSSWLDELRANCAKTVALDKSISNKKKNKASLKHKKQLLIFKNWEKSIATYWIIKIFYFGTLF